MVDDEAKMYIHETFKVIRVVVELVLLAFLAVSSTNNSNLFYRISCYDFIEQTHLE